MFRFLLIFSFVIVSGRATGQSHTGTSTRAGMNVPGYYVEQLFHLGFNRHQFEAGFRFYPLSYLFERNTPGFVAGYSYNKVHPGFVFKSKQGVAGIGISSAVFQETKATLKLTMVQLLLTARMGLCLNPRWSIFYSGAFGCIFNKHSNYNLHAETLTPIGTYEIALGIKYYWRIPAAAN